MNASASKAGELGSIPSASTYEDRGMSNLGICKHLNKMHNAHLDEGRTEEWNTTITQDNLRYHINEHFGTGSRDMVPHTHGKKKK